MNCSLFVLSFCFLASGAVEPDEKLFDDYWSWRLERSPEFATLVGDKSQNDKLENFTVARFAEDLEHAKKFVIRAGELKNQTEDAGEILNLDLFISEQQTFIDGHQFNGFYFPISYLEGLQIDFQRLAEWATPESVADYEAVIARYTLLPDYVDQVIEMLTTAVDSGMTNSVVSMTGVIDQCKAHTDVEPKETVFFEPFENLSTLGADEEARLQEMAESSIKDFVQLGFKTLSDFLENTYIPAARTEIAITSLTDIGPEFYEACLKFHTSTTMTYDDIHNKGLEEVERIEKEMMEIVVEMGQGNLTLPEFTAKIRLDPNNYYDSPEELLEAFHDIIDNRIDGQLLSIFHSKPETKLEIVSMPPSQPDAPAAFYTAGSTDGQRAGRLYVNTNKYASQPKYEMVSLSLHETNPGHHLESSFGLENPDIPLFRKVMEDRIYSQVPSRFPINTAFIEGWGLYSESLGYDMNLYDDPLERYGHLSEEIFRACRLVVDTGMHAKGWSQEKATQYMFDHTAGSEESLRSEITRYITWPGQATAYKIGQLKISELRERATNKMGDQFNIKDFHEVVLRSRGPLYILEQEVDNYIKSAQPNKGATSSVTASLLIATLAVIIKSL